MSFRRTPEQIEGERNWASFVAANLERLHAAGLPELATMSVEHWDDLLMHGRFEYHTDPAHFEIGSLTEDQYGIFVGLVESYFVGGYEYFTPGALDLCDQASLDSRFGP